MSFAEEFRSQWETLERLGEHGVEQFKDLNRFLKRQAEIEDEYAKNIQRMVKVFKDELQKKIDNKAAGNFQKATMSSSCSQSWSQLLNETESIAEIHLNFSVKIREEIRHPLKDQTVQNEKFNQKIFDDIRKMLLDLKKSVAVMESNREKHTRASRDMNNALVSYERASNDPKSKKEFIDKQKFESEKRCSLAREAMEVYTKSIDETNIKKNQIFNDQLPEAINLFQTDDENNRIEYFQKLIQKYSGLVFSQLDPQEKSVNSMISTFKLISASYDSSMFSKMLKTGEGIPEDYTFEERCSPTRSVQSDQSPVSATDDGDDSILNSESKKKGRKLASDRVVQLAKDIDILIAKLYTCGNLLSVKSNSENSEKSQQTLLTQQNDLQYTLEILQTRLKKLEDYITLNGGTLSKRKQPAIPGGGTGSGSVRCTSGSDSIESVSKHSSQPSQSQSTTRKITISSPTNLQNLTSSGNYEEPFTTLNKQVAQPPNYGDTSPTGGQRGWSEEVTIGKTLFKAKALFDFEGGANEDEFSFLADDKFEVTDEQEDGWWRVKKFEQGRLVEGIVPGNYMERIH